MPPAASTWELEAARPRDAAAFERLVAPHRAELLAHCYRMLGSFADAEDALQEALLRAWRGLPGFQGRSSLRSWLYRIATNVCLRAIERRPKRVLPIDRTPAADPHADLDAPVAEPIWLEPYPDELLDDGAVSPEARYERRESVELAFVAALQHLPERQRAVLLLRDVLGFAPSEIADALDATPAAVYSALQRAHAAVEERLPQRSQQATLRAIGDRRLEQLVARYVDAWEAADVDTIVGMLTEEAILAMPPRPTWFQGRADVGAFLAAVPLADRSWRLAPARAAGQLAFGHYAADRAGRSHTAVAITVLTLDPGARIAAMTSFHQPAAFSRFGLPGALG